MVSKCILLYLNLDSVLVQSYWFLKPDIYFIKYYSLLIITELYIFLAQNGSKWENEGMENHLY